jgi:hypothetical protein
MAQKLCTKAIALSALVKFKPWRVTEFILCLLGAHLYSWMERGR